MQKLIDLIIKYKEYFAFLGLVLISLSLITLGDINKVGGYRTIVVATLGWIQKNIFLIPNISGLKTENSTLREMNLQLSNKVMLSRLAEIENVTLRKMLGLREHSGQLYEVASVVGTVSVDMRNYLIIKKGENSGIQRLMAVRTDAGLVGILSSVSKNYAMVELITNPNIKIPALVLRNGILGVISWDGESGFLLKNVPKYADVKTGDTVVTSRHGLKFPPFIPIGEVVSKTEEEGELFSHIVVKPFVNFSYLEEVFVVKNVVDTELQRLIKDTEENLRLYHLPTPKGQKINIKDEKKRIDEERAKEKNKK